MANTTGDMTMAYIARGGEQMQTTAAAVLARGEFNYDDVASLAVAIIADFEGGTVRKSVPTDRAISIVRLSLVLMDHYDLRSTVERMANSTADDAAWTYGFYVGA